MMLESERSFFRHFWQPGISGIYYTLGQVSIGIDSSDQSGLYVRNYISGKSAVRGTDQNAGNIYAELIPEGNNNSELNSGVGNITLKVPESASVTIVATINVFMWSGDEGDLDNINSDFTPTKIDRSKESKQIEVTYELNGGGNKIELNVALGNINIQKL